MGRDGWYKSGNSGRRWRWFHWRAETENAGSCGTGPVSAGANSAKVLGASANAGCARAGCTCIDTAASRAHEIENKMSTASPTPTEANAAEYWHALLHPALQKHHAFAQDFLKQLRTAKLTFGDRLHCPFLRPFFLSPQDEDRVRPVAETIAELGERVARAALADEKLFAQFHLRPEEARLARLPGGDGRVSTASRLDAFLLPESLKFAEYNGESPAGAGYSETLGEIFSALPLMAQFSKRYEVHSYPLSAKLLDALVLSYLDWGGKSK